MELEPDASNDIFPYVAGILPPERRYALPLTDTDTPPVPVGDSPK
nr:MAG TPA: hypothetical protein [Caudoviricetes sp.]